MIAGRQSPITETSELQGHLRVLNRYRVMPSDGPGQLHGSVQDLVGRNDLVDESPCQGFLGRETPAGEDELFGPGRPN